MILVVGQSFVAWATVGSIALIYAARVATYVMDFAHSLLKELGCKVLGDTCTCVLDEHMVLRVVHLDVSQGAHLHV